MQAAVLSPFIGVDEYLDGEERSELRHEYIGGAVYGMAGTSDDHNSISLNLAAGLQARLRGGRCRVFIAEVKARLAIENLDIFYYPDIMVTCDPRENDRYFKRFPKLIIEVLSESTESTDRREKFWNYTKIETLEEYVLVAQDRIEVTVFRRSRTWAGEVFTQLEHEVRLDSVDHTFLVRDIYEGVQFSAKQNS